MGTRCELCGGAAAVHCAADSAFLCPRCDATVHGANFLASRHVRRRLPRGGAESGASASASASSGSCLSTADSAQSRAAPPPPGRGRRAEAVLEGWARRKRVAAGPACRRRIPLRVAMAAARWSGVSGGGGAEAAVVAVAAWWMTRAARARPPAGAPDLEEGWAECSPEFVVRQGPHPSALCNVTATCGRR